jgi:hypothetical protein
VAHEHHIALVMVINTGRYSDCIIISDHSNKDLDLCDFEVRHNPCLSCRVLPRTTYSSSSDPASLKIPVSTVDLVGNKVAISHSTNRDKREVPKDMALFARLSFQQSPVAQAPDQQLIATT